VNTVALTMPITLSCCNSYTHKLVNCGSDKTVAEKNTKMKNTHLTGRSFYSIGIAGIGLVHFFYSGFRPVILPVRATAMEHLKVLPLLTGASLIFAGIWIALGKKVRLVSLCLGIELALFFLLGHLPNRIVNSPEVLGAWTDALKLLALSGGAFAIAHNASEPKSSGLDHKLSRVTVIGRYLFAIMLFAFGIDHFLYVDLVKSLVPQWIPYKYFWTYVTGIALIGSGVSIAFNLWNRSVSLLLGSMLLLWLLLLHLPATLADLDKDAINIISSLECLAFSGIAFLMSANDKRLLFEKDQVAETSANGRGH